MHAIKIGILRARLRVRRTCKLSHLSPLLSAFMYLASPQYLFLPALPQAFKPFSLSLSLSLSLSQTHVFKPFSLPLLSQQASVCRRTSLNPSPSLFCPSKRPCADARLQTLLPPSSVPASVRVGATMATRACIPRVGMKAFPSSSASASASSSVEVVTMEYELRIRRKYFWVERAGEGRQRVVAVTAGDPSEVDVRTFRPSCPGVFNHLMPLYPFNLLASFGIAEDDISMSEEVREEMFCFVCNAAHEAKLAGNDRLKIVFSMNFFYVRTLASSPPEDNDPDLDRAVRESWALEQEERNTRRRRRRQLSDEEDEDEEESIMKKLKKVKYGSSSSSSSSSSSAEEEVDSRYCFSDCRICLEEFSEEEELSLMPCGHTFHSACILRWLTTADSCPTCRFQLY